MSLLGINNGVSSQAVNDSIKLVDTVSPSGTTINVFDYWRGDYDGGRTGNDTNNPGSQVCDWANAGINEGHTLKFGNNMKGELFTTDSNGDPNGFQSDVTGLTQEWVGDNWIAANLGGNNPVSGIVAGELGQDGYPVLSGGDVVTSRNGTSGTESLSYLFDLNNIDNAKQAYGNVQGLLKVDEGGYYVYDAKQNFAQFNEDTNDFTVYNAWGISNANENYTDRDGQFFLFNNATTDGILTDSGDTLHDNGVHSNDARLNHYFGLSMSTQFAQLHGGYTTDDHSIPVTYNFSGDDDVWVYIDGYLVGDLGGIHSACALDINFSTGEVIVFKDANLDNDYNSADDGDPLSKTTIREMMAQAAGSDEAVAALFEGNTSVFKDGSIHTLDFFYMERGNTDSNMSLKFNMQELPETYIEKVNQDGGFVEGAHFTVTGAKANGTTETICSGTTNADGELVLMQPDTHILITPDWLVQQRYETITLSEDGVPDGYRSTGDIVLDVTTLPTTAGGNVNLLLSHDQWSTGAYAQPKVKVTAASTIGLDGHDDITTSDLRNGSGMLFAVIQKKEMVNCQEVWRSVTGNALDGWQVDTTNTDKASAIAAGQSTDAVFEIGMSGNFETEIDNLPGGIENYQFFSEDGEYRGAYYYTDATSWDDVSENNTWEVENPQAFDRQFSAVVYVSDIINRVVVQKTDADTGEAIDGATLALFDASQVTKNADGTYTLKDGATPIGGSANPTWSDTTRALNKVNDKIDLDGAVVFTGLEPGVYFVGEVSASSGYAKTNEAARIIVTTDGVYADAGRSTDGVAVTRGVGRLVDSMAQFAADNGIDATLQNIVATPKLGTADTSGGTPTVTFGGEATGDAIHLTYNPDGDQVLDYEITSGTGSTLGYRVESGIPGLTVTQCNEHQTSDSGANRTPLVDEGNNLLDITGLFTGTTVVHLDNEKIGTLTISKDVQGKGASSTQEFSFTVNLTDANGVELTGSFVAQKYTGTTPEGQPIQIESGDQITLTDGQRIVIEGLASGVQYTVTEAATDGYLTVASVDDAKVTDADETAGFTAEGSIPTDGSSTVTFTNTAFDTGEAKDVFATDEDGNKIDGSIDDQPVQVGDILTYEVSWVNYEPTTATVTVTDNIPAGTEFVSADPDAEDAVAPDTDGKLTWNLGEKQPGASGTITFQVRVTDEAVASTVENTATIIVGTNNPDVSTNTTHNPVPGKSVTNSDGAADNDGSTAQVGDTLTYTVSFQNRTEGATVVVTDTLDEGLTFVENTTAPTFNAAFEQNEQNPQQLTWTIEEAPAGEIVISFTAKVNEKAVVDAGSVPNAAKVQVGDNSNIAVDTNTVTTQTQTGNLVVGKTVKDADGNIITSNDDFRFTIALTDAGDQPLTGTYELTIGNNTVDLSFAADAANNKPAGTASFSLKGGETATISGLPEGTQYTVTEDDYTNDGYTTTKSGDTGTINAAATVQASFTNTYKPGEITLSGNTALKLNKKVVGADTDEDFSFTATFNAGESAKQDPAGTVAGIKGYSDSFKLAGNVSESFSAGETKSVSLSEVTFTEPGTYVFDVTEDQKTAPAGWSYDNSTKQITVTIKDNGNGQLVVDGNASEPTFTNVYFNNAEAKDVFATDNGGNKTGSSIDGQLVGIGDTLTYEVAWANTTSEPAKVVVTDAIPVGTTIAQDTDGADIISHDGVLSNGTITWDLGTKQPGDSGTVSFAVVVTEDAVAIEDPENTVTNGATITIGENDSGVELKTNTTENPVPEKDETSNASSVAEGTELTYQISFKNTDGAEATAEVVDELTKGQEYITGSSQMNGAQIDDPGSEGSAENGQKLTWSLSGLDDNADVVLTFKVRVTRDAGASVDNTATVNGHKTNIVTTPYPSDTTKDVALATDPTTSINGKLVSVGDELVYTINWAADADGSMVITDTVPAGTALVENDDAISDGGTNNNGVITWNIGNVSKGDKGTVSFTVRVTEDAVNNADNPATPDINEENNVTNQASIKIGDNDPTVTNTTENPVPENPVKDVFKNDDMSASVDGKNVAVGDVLTYQVTWTAPADGADDVVITDTVPTGTVLDESSLDTNASVENGVITWNVGDLDGGDSVTVTFKVTVDKSASGNTVENTATVQVGANGPKVDTNEVTNPVNPAPTSDDATISATKALVGRDWDDSDSFTFTLAGVNGNGTQDGFQITSQNPVTLTKAEATAAVGSDATDGAKVPFSWDVTFTQAGTYTFTITEDTTGLADKGITPQPATHQVTVVVTDAKGIEVIKEPTTIDFTNTYTPGAATSGLTATKTVNGESNGLAAGSFTFKIEPVDGAPLPTGVAADGTVTNGANGVVDFGTFNFSQANTYTYHVSEVNTGKPGYTYDTATYTVVFNVADTDLTNSALEVTRTIYKSDQATGTSVEAMAFANTYKPGSVTTPVDAPFSGTKIVTDEHGSFGALKGGEFTFVMTNTAKPATVGIAPAPSNGSSVQNDAAGSFDFGTLTFTEPGTYTYTVREQNTGVAGITYDDQIYTLGFTVEDEEGKLVITSQTITNKAGEKVNAGNLDFTNIYNDGQVSVDLSGAKTLDTGAFKGESLQEGAFTFVLLDQNGAEIDRTANGASNGNTAFFAFGPLTYTADDLGQHAYRVVELGADDQPGTGGTDANNIGHSTQVYTVTVTVSQDTDAQGSNALKAAVAIADADGQQVSAISFTNTYTPTPAVVGPNGSAQIGGTKQLSGRALNADEFSFELLQGDQVISTAKNNADGTFTFGDDLTFTAEGTYTYAVREAAGSLGGVTYDDALYTVVITVTEDADANALVPTVTYQLDGHTVDAVTFSNAYTTAPAVLGNLGAVKRLENGELKDGQFTFELTAADGAPMPEETSATNAANGTVNFGPITYTEPGEYDYTITEVNDAQDGITYDADSTRTVHVSVTDNLQGSLVATVDYGENNPVFVNTVETDESTEPGEPTEPEEPSEPAEPSEPTEPEQPVTPEEPAQPADTDKSDEDAVEKADTLPTTGDYAPLIAGGAAVVALALVAGGVIIRRRQQR